MITTLIFDLDGTLVDSLEDLAQTTNQLLQHYHYPTHELDAYRRFVGNGVDKLILRALPKDVDFIPEMRTMFDQLYQKHCLDHTNPYPGIKELLDALKDDYHLAVVTNKPNARAHDIVDHLFPNTFDYVFGQTIYQPKKPNPTVTRLVMDLLEVSKGEVIYIGDSDVDIETAKNAHIKSIGCSWGFRGKAELLKAGAHFVVDKPQEIKAIVDDRR